MFSAIYNWFIGRMPIKCSYCGKNEYIAASSFNPTVIYCCSNSCSYKYYDTFCVPSSPSYNKQFDGMIRIQIS